VLDGVAVLVPVIVQLVARPAAVDGRTAMTTGEDLGDSIKARVFTYPRPNLIVCDAGFSIELSSATQLIYREGGREALIGIEPLVGPRSFAFDKQPIGQWNAPHEREPIDDGLRDRISANIVAGLASKGLQVDVSTFGYPVELVPNAGATAPRDGTSINVLLRRKASHETSISLIAWNDDRQAWVTALGRDLSPDWALLAWRPESAC